MRSQPRRRKPSQSLSARADCCENQELPAQKAGGRYKGKPHDGGVVL